MLKPLVVQGLVLDQAEKGRRSRQLYLSDTGQKEEIPDSDVYVNQVLTASACCVELSAHSPMAASFSVET